MAYVQFKDLSSAQMALDAMNGFEIANRASKSPAHAQIYADIAVRVSTVEERNAYGQVGAIESLEEPSLNERHGGGGGGGSRGGGGDGGYGSRMDAAARQQLMFKLARTDQTGSSVPASRSSAAP